MKAHEEKNPRELIGKVTNSQGTFELRMPIVEDLITLGLFEAKKEGRTRFDIVQLYAISINVPFEKFKMWSYVDAMPVITLLNEAVDKLEGQT